MSVEAFHNWWFIHYQLYICRCRFLLPFSLYLAFVNCLLPSFLGILIGFVMYYLWLSLLDGEEEEELSVI